MKILIIDDDQSYRTLFKTLFDKLSGAFYSQEIIESINLETAILAVKEHDPEVIFLDIFLPDADVHEVFHQIEIFKNRAYIVAISNTDNSQTIIDVMKAGADDFVSKKDLLSIETLQKKLEDIYKILKDRSADFKDDRKPFIDSAVVDLAKHRLTDNDLAEMIEFLNWSKYNLSKMSERVEKLYKTMFETNGTPSMKEQVSTAIDDLNELKQQIEGLSEEADEEEMKKGGLFWTGFFGFLSAVATALIALIIKIFGSGKT